MWECFSFKGMKRRQVHTFETGPSFTPLFHTIFSDLSPMTPEGSPGWPPPTNSFQKKARQMREGFGGRQPTNPGISEAGAPQGYETTPSFIGAPKGMKRPLFHRVLSGKSKKNTPPCRRPRRAAPAIQVGPGNRVWCNIKENRVQISPRL